MITGGHKWVNHSLNSWVRSRPLPWIMESSCLSENQYCGACFVSREHNFTRDVYADIRRGGSLRVCVCVCTCAFPCVCLYMWISVFYCVNSSPSCIIHFPCSCTLTEPFPGFSSLFLLPKIFTWNFLISHQYSNALQFNHLRIQPRNESYFSPAPFVSCVITLLGMADC